MKKKSLLDDNGEPRFCLCQKRWYKILFGKNPLLINKFYWFGWIDPESWLEWWYLGTPIRFYYWKREKWIDFPFTQRRGIKMWENATPVEIERPKRTTDDDDAGRGA